MSYDIPLAAIICDILKDTNNKIVKRTEIKRRWLIKYPHHDVPVLQKNRARKGRLVSSGTRAKYYINDTIRDLERRGLIQRVDEGLIRVTDLPNLVETANKLTDKDNGL